jgi:hypothetical protein
MDDYLVDTIEYRGFNIKVFSDPEPFESPREWENLGKMLCSHSRYELGDEQIGSEQEMIYCILNECNYPNPDQLDDDLSELDNLEFIEKYASKMYKLATVLPLYLYDHSGITMNTSGFSCPWDSGQVGVIYVSNQSMKKEFNRKHMSKKLKQKAIDHLRSEVKVYDQYLTGEIYGFNIEPTDRNKSIECEDSCWGFYGYDHEKSGLLEHAKPSIDYEIKKYKESVIANWKRKLQINAFMHSCWAY